MVADSAHAAQDLTTATVVRRLGRPAVAFTLLTLAILGFYLLLRAPVLNGEDYLDPWIYTAAFTNFGAMYRLFGETYYLSRLPWLIPGITVHSVLPPLAAFFVLHIVYFVAGGGFAFLLFKRFYGLRVALLAYAALMLNPLFYDSYSNDYPDGAVLTYLFGASYFAFSAAPAKRRRLRLVAAGFFAAAAVGTNLFASVVIVGLGIAYFIVTVLDRQEARCLVRDVGALLVGGFLLLLGCGSFSLAYGGPFLFFMPQWRFARSVNTTQWKLHGYGWLKHEPQLLIPLIALLIFMAAVLRARRRLREWRSDPRIRLAVASAVFLAYLSALIAVWEFAFSGDFLELSYYFTLFNIPVALTLAASLHLLVQGETRVVAVAVGIASAGLPLLLVYGLRVAPTATQGAVVTVTVLGATGLVVGALVSVSTRVIALRRVAALGVALAVLFLPNFAAASGGITATVFQTGAKTFADRRAALDMSMQLIDFVRQHGLQRTTPNFWYDDKADPVLDGVQSTYLWATTYIGRRMPDVDSNLRKALRNRQPEALILLASSPTRLTAGATAVRALGYHLQPLASGTLQAGPWRVRAVAYRIEEFYRSDDKYSQYYGSALPDLSRLPQAPTVAMWDFSAGVPRGWTKSGEARVKPGAPTFGSVVVTSDHQWNYELQGPKQTLSAGNYGVYLSGAVLRGGIDLGILDARQNVWLAQQTYWFRERGFARLWMHVSVDLSASKEVEIVFSNWGPPNTRSRWRLRELRVVRLPG